MTTTPQPTETPKKTKGFTRSMTVLVLLLGGVVALIGSTQTWVTATGFEAAHITNVQLSGQEASPVITAMSLVVVAAGAALSITRSIGRWLIGIVAILSSLAIGWTTINVLINPLDAAAQEIAETTGTTGMEDIAANIDVSLLPWLTVLGSLITLLGGIAALVVGSRWPVGKSKKYEINDHKQPDQHGQLDEIDTWDELSRGEDPT